MRPNKSYRSLSVNSLSSKGESEEEEIHKDNLISYTIVNIFSCSFGLLCFAFLESLNIIYMGYTTRSEVNMASVGLGNIFLNFFGVLMGFGAIGGLDTMGSYCYGQKKHRLLGIYTIRTRINLFILFVFICVPFSYISESLIVFLNDDPVISHQSSCYIWNMLPAVLMTFLFNLNVRYLQVIQIYFAPTIIVMIGIILHFFLCYIFIILLQFEVRGICLATFLSMTTLFVFTTIYIFLRKRCNLSRFIYDSRVFNYEEFVDYFMLCVYSGIQHYGDYIGYEIITVFGALLNVESFIATIVVLNYANLIGYLYVGCAYPLSHFVGYFLAKENFEMYYYVIDLFFKIFFAQASILGFITIYFSREIASLYTGNDQIIYLASSLFKIWGIGIVFDAFNMKFQGILRGAGKQKIVSMWNLLSAFFWMIPVSYLLGLICNFGIIGLYLGVMATVTILCFVNWYYYVTLNLMEVVIILNSINQDDESIKAQLDKFD